MAMQRCFAVGGAARRLCRPRWQGLPLLGCEVISLLVVSDGAAAAAAAVGLIGVSAVGTAGPRAVGPACQ